METNSQGKLLMLLKRVTSFMIPPVVRGLKFCLTILLYVVDGVEMFKKIRLDFTVRGDDIYIVSYPRSGTTWMQMILYQLVTEGDMNLSHISIFSPFLDTALAEGQDLTRHPSPRVFKSHLPYRWMPKGPCKYIYVARDGRDVAVSYYHFCKIYQGFRGTFADFFEAFMKGKVVYGSWFDHVSGWWSHKDALNVLFLWYEDIVDDLEGTIRKISDFCGFEISPERFPVILERCSFSFMKAHEAKFDPATNRPEEMQSDGNSFIRRGRIGDHDEYLSEAQQAIFQKRFAKQMKQIGAILSEKKARRPLKNIRTGEQTQTPNA